MHAWGQGESVLQLQVNGYDLRQNGENGIMDGTLNREPTDLIQNQGTSLNISGYIVVKISTSKPKDNYRQASSREALLS